MGIGRRGTWPSAQRIHVTGMIAAVGHALAVVLLARGQAPRVAPGAATDPIAAMDFEVDTEPEVPPAPPPPEEHAVAPPAAAPAAARVSVAVARGAAPRAVTEVGAGEGPPAGGAAASGSQEVAAGPGSSPVVAATAAPAPDRLPPPLAPRALHAPAAIWVPLAGAEAPAPTSASAQVRGSVQRVLEASGPRQGHGTIRITVEEDGSVSSVVASGTGWEAAAQALRAALSGRRFHVPKGAHGVTLAFLVEARVTRVPPVLTGEARATATGIHADGYVPPPTDDEHRGGIHPPPPTAAVINPLALLPIPRRVVKLESLGEQPR